MNKLVTALAILLGLGLGLLWPLNQNHQPPVAEEVAGDLPPLPDEAPIDQQPIVDQPAAQPEPQPPSTPLPAPDPEQPPEQPEPVPATKTPPAAPQPATKPQVRVVKGQAPEEVRRSFHRSQPLKRSTSRQNIPPTVNKPPTTSPKTKPDTTTPKPATKSPQAQPVDGNYCYLAYGYPGWSADVAFAVCMGESGGQPGAINPKDNHGSCRGSYGLFQIGCIHADPDDMLDPQQNIDKAYELHQNQGWQPWGAYKNGSYRRHLPKTS